MSTMQLTQNNAQERLSVLLVMGVALIALLLGGLVKTAVSDQTRSVTQNGITADVPAGWLVQDGTGDLRVVVRNPRSLSTRYRVNVLDGADLAAVAADRSDERSSLDDSFRVLEETPIVVNGRDGYKVGYAFINDPDAGMPSVIEGADYYFADGDAVVVISFEADAADFEADFSQFQQFRETVVYQAGG